MDLKNYFCLIVVSLIVATAWPSAFAAEAECEMHYLTKHDLSSLRAQGTPIITVSRAINKLSGFDSGKVDSSSNFFTPL